MKININKDLLQKTLIIAESIISSKNINIILTNCLFNVRKDFIEILSTDSEVSVRSIVDAVSDGEMKFLINAKSFINILKDLPNDEITLDINESYEIKIKSKSKEVKGHYTLHGISAEEFPEIQKFDDDKSFEIEQSTLKEIIKKVIYAASIETIKPIFNGLFLTTESENSLTAVCTDSRRLSVISRKIDNNINIGEGIIIPLKTINEILRLLEGSGNCRIIIDDKLFFIKIGNSEIISRIVEGNFPNYKQVIPVEKNIEVIIETKRFYNSVKRVMNFTKEPAYKIIMTFNKNNLMVEASSPEIGNAEEEVVIESNSDETISIGINSKFLLDSLKEIDSHSIVCGITGQMSPLTIIPEDDSSYKSVIMPIQIKTDSDN